MNKRDSKQGYTELQTQTNLSSEADRSNRARDCNRGIRTVVHIPYQSKMTWRLFSKVTSIHWHHLLLWAFSSSQKMMEAWGPALITGAFTITKQINPVTYRLQLLPHYHIHSMFHGYATSTNVISSPLNYLVLNSTADMILGHTWLIHHCPVISWSSGGVLKWGS